MTTILDAALAYASAVQAAMRQAQAAYAGDEDCLAAQRNLVMMARAVDRSDKLLADAYGIDQAQANSRGVYAD